ncbi:hypothetical protein HRI_000782100 [Hibiscus trionum]|uniref:GTD-binding domain-containing protein n=1 Tax=Hibiscus trionum TaxID=183268 RepID=A0A9W7H5M2_HIBTR|nr:hypothetical protein HRI_000782100 [Hibiscus trionum]
MESEIFSPRRDSVKCCDCACPTCSLIGKPSSTWLRSVKRKYDEFETGNQFYVPEFDLYSNPKVQIENECVALRETVSTQQATIQDLQTELEKERNASSSAANEAMSMILKLQKQKAEIQMEASQFKRFAEEKMAHDQEEILALEDILYKREEGVESLTCEAMAYKHRMMSYGLTEADVEGEKDGEIQSMGTDDNFDAEVDLPAYDYPPLKCSLNENPGDEIEDIEKYAFGETPNTGEQLRDLEQRLFQVERDPSSSQLDGGFPGRNMEQRLFQVERDPSNSRMDGGFPGRNVEQRLFQVERDPSNSQMDGGFPGRNVEQRLFQVETDPSNSRMDGGFPGRNVEQRVFPVERDSSSSQMDGGFPERNEEQRVFQVERDPNSSQMDGGFPGRNEEQRNFQVEWNPSSSQMDGGFPVRNLEQRNFQVERNPINNQMDGGFPIRNLEQRNLQEERNPSRSQMDGGIPGTKNVLEKVIVGHSPRRTRHSRRVSTESYNSLLAKETASEFTIDSPRFNIGSPRFNASYKKMEFVSKMDEISNSRRMGNTSEVADDMSDRVYTIDSVYHGATYNETPEPKLGAETANEYASTPWGDFNLPDACDPYIKKLYTRLQALEADRESMRQALLSMRTDKAQLVLLKEIAQHLSKEMPSNRQVVAKPSILGSLPFMPVFKWIASLIFWRRKARRSKYLYGFSPNNVGLLMLLDKGPRLGQWRCLSSTQV